MKKLLSLLLVFCSLALISVNVAATDQFGLKDFSGKATSLDDHIGKGKWRVVVLWASDCHACNQEAEQYIQFHEEYKDKHIELLGISLDGEKKRDDAKDFIKRHDVTFPNLIGEFNSVVTLYESLSGGQWLGTPTILVFNPKGELKAAQPGAVPTGLIEEFINGQVASATSTK